MMSSRTRQLYTGHWLIALNQNSGKFITTKAEKFVLKLTFFPQNDFIKRKNKPLLVKLGADPWVYYTCNSN